MEVEIGHSYSWTGLSFETPNLFSEESKRRGWVSGPRYVQTLPTATDGENVITVADKYEPLK